MSYPDWLDERIHLGEVPKELQDKAQARLQEPDFEVKQKQLSESNEQILSELPAAHFSAEVLRRHQSAQRTEQAIRRSSPGFKVWGSALILGSLALLFAWLPQTPMVAAVNTSQVSTSETPTHSTLPQELPESSPSHSVTLPNPTPESKWRTKGSIGLSVLQETSEGLKPVGSKDLLPVGTRLRLSVPVDLKWAVLLSIDSRNQISQHWPRRGYRALPLKSGFLDQAWELDNSPGQETFVLVWSSKPFAVNEIQKAILENRTHPNLPDHLKVNLTSILRAAPKTP